MRSPKVISVHQAKRRLSRLVQRVAAGETILIGPGGHAVVKLTGVDAPAGPKRRLGFLKGKLKVPDDFDAPLPAGVVCDFEGGL